MRFRRRLTSALVVSLLTGLAFVGSPAVAQAPGSITIRLLEASTARADDPRSRVYINDHVEPGATITRRIEVSNTTGAAQDLQFYAAAAALNGGSFAIGDGRAVNELSSWTTVDPPAARVADGGRTVLTARIRVPRDASPGERYAAVVAEVPAPPTAPGRVSTASRVGIRIYLSVGPGGEPASDFTIDTITAGRDGDGSAVVDALVRNTGGRALDLAGELRLAEGPAGLSAGPYDVQLGTTLGVGQSAPVSIVLDKALPAGPWLAELTLRSGLLERQARAQITFPDAAGAEAEAVVAENLSPSEDPKILVPIAGSLILLIILALLWWLIARRRSKEDDEEQDEELVPAG